MELSEIQWQFYPRVAGHPQAKRWIEILAMLQKAPKTIDAYARNLDDFLAVCEHLALSVVTADRGDIARYIDDLTRRRSTRPLRQRAGSGGLANATLQQHLTTVRLFYAGLRSDEISRLPVGCIRWQWEDDMHLEMGEVPEDATCFLYVPVNKTETAFWKPVYGLVGKRIAAWERVRPQQPSMLDEKTGQMRDFLFAYRGLQLSKSYINHTLIPLLCERAGVPRQDTRGNITSHRARATIATVLYNASDDLTIEDMQYLLGHKTAETTRSYIKVQLTRLAKKVAQANKNARMAEGLFDPVAASRGEPSMFYHLGNGCYCGNPLWVTCPQRLACLKCDAYIPRELGQLIEVRNDVVRFSMEVPLSAEEQDAVDGDVEKLNEMIERRKHLPPPPSPTIDMSLIHRASSFLVENRSK